MTAWEDLKSSCNDYLPGALLCFLDLRAQFQMLILVCLVKQPINI